MLHVYFLEVLYDQPTNTQSIAGDSAFDCGLVESTDDANVIKLIMPVTPSVHAYLTSLALSHRPPDQSEVDYYQSFDFPDPIPPFPISRHITIVADFQPGQVKPLGVTLTYHGKDYTFYCFVTQDIVDAFLSGNLVIGDYVIVDFIEYDHTRPIASQKVKHTW